MATSFESKLYAAYRHGRMDFLAGAPCKPETPLAVYGGLCELHRNIVMQAWVDGWYNESLAGLRHEERA